jgi:hypothetical protein
MGFRPGGQLGGTEGLGHVVIGSQAQPPNFVNVVLPCGHENDRNLTAFADAPADSETAGSRKHEIQNDQVPAGFLRFLLSKIAVFDDSALEVFGLQVIPHQLRNAAVVLNDQYLFHPYASG